MHLGQDGLVGRGLLQDAPIRVDHRGAPAAPFANAVDADEITLVEQGIRAAITSSSSRSEVGVSVG